MAKILKGTILRDKIKKQLILSVKKLGFKPSLAIIQVGDRDESNLYIKTKKKFGEDVGVEVSHLKFPENISEKDLVSEIKRLNNDNSVSGIIVQFPIPKNLNEDIILDSIDSIKDVDGLTSKNISLLFKGSKDGIIPATTLGISNLLRENNIKVSGENVAIIGRSILVGRPTAMLMLKENATVTICHSKTKNLKEICRDADIIIVAIGKPKFIKKDFVKAGQTIIDVGINRMKDGICGDVDFENVSKIVKAISPVPCGVGPLTVASLFLNVLKCAERQNGKIEL